MRLLLTLRDSDIFADAQAVDMRGFKIREAARAVIRDGDNKIALLRATTYNYHKLPGGGVEHGENMAVALSREAMEEIGCEINVEAEVGEVIEYRDRWKMKQISHCYRAIKTGEQQEPQFTESEMSEGFEVVWANNIEDAIELLEHDQPSNYDGRFIQKRDLALLKAAKGQL